MQSPNQRSTSLLNPICPFCEKFKLTKHGLDKSSRQRYICLGCKRTVVNPISFTGPPWHYLYKYLHTQVNDFLNKPEKNLSREIVGLIDNLDYCNKIEDVYSKLPNVDLRASNDCKEESVLA